MVNKACVIPTGMIEDFPVQIGKFFAPVDFIVADIEFDEAVPIILGRPFLATVGALINVKEGFMTFDIGGELIEFRFNQLLKGANEEECNAIQESRRRVLDAHSRGGGALFTR